MTSASLASLGLQAVAPSEEELPFVMDAWCRSYRDSPWAGTITNDRYQAIQRWTISALLERGATLLVVVPLDPSVPRRALGFVCFEPGILHYVYIKKQYRGKGICRGLLAAAGPLHTLTHRTRASRSLLDGGMRWDPVPARVKELKRGA